jgi:pilus assembly protein CpaB
VTQRGAGVAARLRDVGRAMLWHRRVLAAGLTAAAVAVALHVLAPDPPPTVEVLAASRDLAGGAALRPGDVDPVALPRASVPDGALTSPSAIEGRVLAGPVRRGEPLTDVRLVGRELLAGYAGEGEALVATPVRIADAGAAGLLRPGDVVDVLAADTGEQGSAAASRIAEAVRVLTVPRSSDEGTVGTGPGAGLGADLGDGALVVLATSSDVAARLARAAVTARLSVTLRSR